jgi:hypothetical protein
MEAYDNLGRVCGNFGTADNPTIIRVTAARGIAAIPAEDVENPLAYVQKEDERRRLSMLRDHVYIDVSVGSGGAVISSGATTEACEQPEGYAAVGGDCDDSNGDAFPGAAEICDGVDNNCDGQVDNGGTSVTQYTDGDGDGYGDGDFYGNGDGYGDGTGGYPDGDGTGYGDFCGYPDGDGTGYGEFYGDFYGNGDGDGDFYGNGDGDG